MAPATLPSWPPPGSPAGRSTSGSSCPTGRSGLTCTRSSRNAASHPVPRSVTSWPQPGNRRPETVTDGPQQFSSEQKAHNVMRVTPDPLCWSGTRWAPARSSATWQPTAPGGWPRACWSPRSAVPAADARQSRGLPQGLFDGFVQAATADTPAWMKGFLDNFYNVQTLRGTLISDQAYPASWNLAVTASATAAAAP